MSDLDLERLGDVWRQPPSPEALEEIRRSAESVRKRARLALIVDTLVAVAVSAVVILLVLSNPRTETVVIGSAAILVLIGSQVRQRRVRQVELRSLTGTTEEMLDQSIGRLRLSLRHNRFSLAVLGPVFLIGYLVARAAGRRSGDMFGAVGDTPAFRALLFGIALVVVAGGVLAVVRKMRRQRSELERLMRMRGYYRDQTDVPDA